MSKKKLNSKRAKLNRKKSQIAQKNALKRFTDHLEEVSFENYVDGLLSRQRYKVNEKYRPVSLVGQGAVAPVLPVPDIHMVGASKTFNTPVPEVTREQRSIQKLIDFGTLYGDVDLGLSGGDFTACQQRTVDFASLEECILSRVPEKVMALDSVPYEVVDINEEKENG